MSVGVGVGVGVELGEGESMGSDVSPGVRDGEIELAEHPATVRMIRAARPRKVVRETTPLPNATDLIPRRLGLAASREQIVIAWLPLLATQGDSGD